MKSIDTAILVFVSIPGAIGAFVGLFSIAYYNSLSDVQDWLIPFTVIFGIFVLPVVWLVVFAMLGLALSLAKETGRYRDFLIASSFMGLLAGVVINSMVGVWDGLLFWPYMLLVAAAALWVGKNYPSEKGNPLH